MNHALQAKFLLDARSLFCCTALVSCASIVLALSFGCFVAGAPLTVAKASAPLTGAKASAPLTGAPLTGVKAAR